MRRTLTLIVCICLLAVASQVVMASSAERITLRGGPGSVTINGEQAPPGTFIYLGFGPTQHIPQFEQLRLDGTWELYFSSEAEQVHIYVDGFRVPGGPWDAAVPGVPHEIRLDVGMEYEPDIAYLVVHTRNDSVTVFGEPPKDHEPICIFREGERLQCQEYGALNMTGFWIPSDNATYTFTVDGVSVDDTSIRANPAYAPFWLSLNAGHPEQPLHRFFAESGDIVDLRCERLPSFVHAVVGDKYHSLTSVAANGSWSIEVPSATANYRIFASTSSHPEFGGYHSLSHYRSTDPGGGEEQVKLNFEIPSKSGERYQLYGRIHFWLDKQWNATGYIQARMGEVVLDQTQLRPGAIFYLSIPVGTRSVSLWANGLPVDYQIYDAVPSLNSETRCVKRVELTKDHFRMVDLAAFAWGHGLALPLPFEWFAAMDIVLRKAGIYSLNSP